MYRFMRILFAFLLLLCFGTALGQDIHGLVVGPDKEAIAYANVVLTTKTDSTYIAGTVTGEDGAFTLTDTRENIPLNECLVIISHIGYRTASLPANADMGTVVLENKTEILGDVVVTAPNIRFDNGRLHVNVQHSMLSNTGNGIEVLSLLPFINRSSDGISVIGRGTPSIYIDNRKVQSTDELQKLSSDEIKNVEIDLHPGASYGNNIRAVIKVSTLRKREGVSFNLAAQGMQNKHFNAYGYGNINYRADKWDFFGGVSARHTYKESNTGNDLEFTDDNRSINVKQDFKNTNRNLALNSNIGLSFSNNGKNDFGVKYDFNRIPSNKDDMSGTSIYSGNGADAHQDNIMLLQTSEKTEHIANAYYITKLGETSKLNVNFDYLTGQTQSAYTSYLNQEKNVEAYNEGNYQLFVGKAEMKHHVWGGQLHYGTEFSYTDNKSSYHTDRNIGTNLTESDDRNRQMLWSIFASMQKSFGDFSFEAGLRFDYTDYEYFHMEKLQKEESRKYSKLLPYFQVDYGKNDVALSLSYSSNVRRPSYSQLNGSTVYVDEYTYKRGNPLLKSAYDHVLDLMFSWKDLMIGITHTWYKNSIMQTTKTMDGQQAILFSMENIPDYREWAAIANYTPTFGFWRPKLELCVFKQRMLYSGRRYDNPYFAYELANLFRLSSRINLSLDVWGTSSGNLYLDTFTPTFRTDIGLNANFLNNSLFVWLKVTDLFNTDKERVTSNINGIVFSKNRKLDNCGVLLQLRYVFNPQNRKYKGATTSSEIIRLN